MGIHGTHRRAVTVVWAVLAAGATAAAACGSDASGVADAAGTETGDAAVAAAANGETTSGPAPAACIPTGEAGALQQRNVDAGGTPRWYLLSAPDNEAEPLPLVIDFHGLAEGAETHAQMTGFGELAMTEGILVAIPHGTGQPVSWNVGPGIVGSNVAADLDFITALIDDVASDHCVDRSRIYATGLSNGAMMSSYAACALDGVFAAVAPVAGASVVDDCVPERPVPFLTIHGTDDPILGFNGGVGDISAVLDGGSSEAVTTEADLDGPGYPAVAAEWAQRNGCDPESVDSEITAAVIHRVWSCPDGADAEMYIVVGGGHSWPASDFSSSIESVVGPTTYDIDATAVAWDFLSRFSAPG